MTSTERRRFVISYDVADDRRRHRVHRVLRSFGDRVQYSVFIADLTPAAGVRVERRLLEVIDASEDSVLIFDLGPSGTATAKRNRALDRRRPLEETRVIVI